MKFWPAGATRVASPHEGVEIAPPKFCKAGAGAAGKVWLKVKPVNGMAALLVMVNVKAESALPPPPMKIWLGA